MSTSHSGNTGQTYDCHRCGESNPSTALVCGGCGSRIAAPVAAAPASQQTAGNSKVKFLPAEQPWWQKTDWIGGVASVFGVLLLCVVLWVFLTRAGNGSSVRYFSGVPLIYLVRFIVNRLFD